MTITAPQPRACSYVRAHIFVPPPNFSSTFIHILKLIFIVQIKIWNYITTIIIIIINSQPRATRHCCTYVRARASVRTCTTAVTPVPWSGSHARASTFAGHECTALYCGWNVSENHRTESRFNYGLIELIFFFKLLYFLSLGW